jgi:homopolymeric O-antigen transport system ATP-binding protein
MLQATDIIDLKFDRVSKKYLIRHESEDHARRNPIVRKLSQLWQTPEEFWAVRNVSFEVRRGEALGIIGHNGAGKSTILKLLANITTPSSGEITINGRLAALIEVGSGFHPELSGRENVYLSGSILGMRRAEITRKIESIIDFAGIRQFIDTPVKRYSSGMFVRLGFSIAAHLEPDILLLDEVLAVGDAAFQAKCLERINDLRDAGKTILFISHDLNAVERMCDRVLLLQRGEVIANGPPVEVIEEYKTTAAEGATHVFHGVGPEREWPNPADAPGDDVVRLSKVRVRNEANQTVSTVDIRRALGIEITFDVLKGGHILVPSAHFFNEERHHIFDVIDVSPEWRRKVRPPGRYVSTAWIPGNFFSEGSLILSIGMATHVPVVLARIYQRDVVAFSVIDTMQGDSARGDYTGPWPGMVRPLVDWTTEVRPSREAEARVSNVQDQLEEVKQT